MFIVLSIALPIFLVSYYLSEKKYTKKFHNILIGISMFSACSSIALMVAIAGTYTT